MRRYRHGRCAGRSPETGAYRGVLDKRKTTTVSIEEVSKLSPSLSLGAAQMLPGYGTLEEQRAGGVVPYLEL